MNHEQLCELNRLAKMPEHKPDLEDEYGRTILKKLREWEAIKETLEILITKDTPELAILDLVNIVNKSE